MLLVFLCRFMFLYACASICISMPCLLYVFPYACFYHTCCCLLHSACPRVRVWQRGVMQRTVDLALSRLMHILVDLAASLRLLSLPTLPLIPTLPFSSILSSSCPPRFSFLFLSHLPLSSPSLPPRPFDSGHAHSTGPRRIRICLLKSAV